MTDGDAMLAARLEVVLAGLKKISTDIEALLDKSDELQIGVALGIEINDAVKLAYRLTLAAMELQSSDADDNDAADTLPPPSGERSS